MTSTPASSCYWLLNMFFLLLVVLSVPVVKGQRFDVYDRIAPLVEKRRSQVFEAANQCVSALNTSLGEEFLSCTLDKLQKPGDDDDDAFPVPPYKLHPLTVEKDTAAAAAVDHSTMLLDLLRNYTCGRIEDGGSPPIDESTWTYNEQTVLEQQHELRTCPANLLEEETEDIEDGEIYVQVDGFLPGGDDIEQQKDLSRNEAEAHCDLLPTCAGFTFETQENVHDMKEENNVKIPVIFFKSKASVKGVQPSDSWQSVVHRRRQLLSYCRNDDKLLQDMQSMYGPPQEYKVQVIRKEPLVLLVPDFASDQDCENLIKAGGSTEEMGRAHERGVGESSYRRSYSSNIDVDYEDVSNDITRFAERMFSFVRDHTGYDVHGPGQEPINAVLYRNVGDEYRPHCDGPCDGGPYPHGQRVATSIVYCQVPSFEKEDGNHEDGKSHSFAGGQTSFTRSGLMVEPRKGQLLLFAYKYENGTMDNGFTEHSGCPILAGQKWIATQWYREGLDYDKTWNEVR